MVTTVSVRFVIYFANVDISKGDTKLCKINSPEYTVKYNLRVVNINFRMFREYGSLHWLHVEIHVENIVSLGREF